MTELRIELQMVPPKELSMNAHNLSRWNVSKVRQVLRQDAALITSDVVRGREFPIPPPYLYDIHVYWGKGRSRADKDNIVTMTKTILDGICDAIGINDRLLDLGRVAQGRDPDGLGWMAIVIRHDPDPQIEEKRRYGEIGNAFPGVS